MKKYIVSMLVVCTCMTGGVFGQVEVMPGPGVAEHDEEMKKYQVNIRIDKIEEKLGELKIQVHPKARKNIAVQIMSVVEEIRKISPQRADKKDIKGIVKKMDSYIKGEITVKPTPMPVLPPEPVEEEEVAVKKGPSAEFIQYKIVIRKHRINNLQQSLKDLQDSKKLSPAALLKVEKDIAKKLIAIVNEIRELSKKPKTLKNLITTMENKLKRPIPPGPIPTVKIEFDGGGEIPKITINMPKKISFAQTHWRSKYIAAKKQKNLVQKLSVLQEIVNKAPSEFWKEKVKTGFWKKKKPRKVNFKNYVKGLSGKVKKKSLAIKKAYERLLIATKNKTGMSNKEFDSAKKKAKI